LLFQSGQRLKASYQFVEDGYDRRGAKLPDVPIVWMELQNSSGRFRGPCLVDTGFDGSIYANEELALLLEGSSPIRTDHLYTVGEREIECEVFGLNAHLITPETVRRVMDLGEIDILVPTRAHDLSREAIVGRRILNALVLKLDGKTLEVL